ncbi:MarR family transcriptional regulator [Lactobacillus sp. XV13L]|nr:MarR family transcriptional regulator [Lactobacillus sp. XV13L]
MTSSPLNDIGPRIKMANTLIEKELNNRVAGAITDYSLTGPQITMLVYLYEAGNKTVTQKELADKFVLSHPTIRSIVRRLVKADLLNATRMEEDRRQIKLTLTAAGTAFIAEHVDDIYAIMADVNRQIVRGISPADLERINDGLQQVISNF